MNIPDPSPQEQTLLAREGLDSLAGAFAYTGGEELSKPGLGLRRRFRLRLTDADGGEVIWYLKRYGPAPLHRRLWRWLVGRGRRGQAVEEIASILDLAAAGVPTMRVVTAGAEANLLGLRRSYLIVTAVPGEALERCLDECLARWDEVVLRQFNAALVDLVRRLHGAGLVHRDLYASHIFLNETPDGPELHLIDLARAFAPMCRRFRWRVKDLAQLKYSMPGPWVAAHWEGFLQTYLGEGSPTRWGRAIDRKVAAMQDRARRKGGPKGA